MRFPKFPSERTLSGDYGYWKSLSHFKKAGAVNNKFNFFFMVPSSLMRTDTLTLYPHYNYVIRGPKEVCTFGGTGKAR